MARGDAQPAPARKARWYQTLWQAYTMTRGIDRAVTWWMLGAFFGVVALALAIGFAIGHWLYMLFIGVPFALLAAMFILARRAERAAYRSIEGQPGAALAALRTIRRGWEFGEQPVAVEPKTQDLVFRGIGRAGVVLVGEGPARVQRLLEAERKKVNRVLPNVPVHVFQAGDGEGQVPLRKLPSKVQRLKPTLTKAETAEIGKRLRALGGASLPVPKGIDPTRVRPDRKGMRGR